AMSAYQPDAETSQQAGQHNGEGPPAFRVVRRGYDPEEVDTYFSQLAVRLKKTVDQYATAERARTELQDEVASLQQRAPSVEQVRAAMVRETDQIREFRDELLDNLDRMHGEINSLLKRTHKQQNKALGF